MGEFLSGLVPLAVILLTQYDLTTPNMTYIIVLGVILFYGLFSPFSPLLSSADYGSTTTTEKQVNHGIADERGWYYQTWGLLRSVRNTPALRCKLTKTVPSKL